MEPRLSLVTLGVADIARARAFYERMGFTASAASNDSVTFFRAGGTVLALFGRADLAADAGVVDDKEGSFRGITLAHNVRSEPEVDAVLADATAAGGRIVKPAQRAFWGGWTGYFADPDGHFWEVAHNPHFPLDADGSIVLP